MTISKPKYIGFLEYLYIPDVTRLLTFLNFIGSIVVLDFTNLETGIIKMKIPIKSIRIENKVWFGKWITSILFDEKKFDITKNKAIMGGGIFNIFISNVKPIFIIYYVWNSWFSKERKTLGMV